jgi:hypothetical protein
MVKRSCASLGLALVLLACSSHEASAPAPVSTIRKASAMLDSVTGQPLATDLVPLSGEGSFLATSAGINLTVKVIGCEFGKTLSLRLLDAGDCGQDSVASRGEEFSLLTCPGTSGVGTAYYMRDAAEREPWTLGGPATHDLVGRALAIYRPGPQGAPVACGVITADPAMEGFTRATPVDTSDPRKLEIQAQLAGLCLARAFLTFATDTCPDPAFVVECASAHCDLEACRASCADQIACLEATSGDVCEAQASCIPEGACAGCQGDLQGCMTGFCAREATCVPPPAPNGPCRQLEACCAKQGDREDLCLEWVRVNVTLGGDPSCNGLMHDWDFLTNIAFDPVCATPPGE